MRGVHWLLGGISIEIVAFALIASLGDIRSSAVAFVALYLTASIGYLVAVAALLRGSAPPPRLAFVAVAALLLRIPVLFACEPSDDMNRYLWEGRILNAGHDPYTTAPTDPSLARYAADDPYHGAVNHPDWPAIYPPVTMLWHAGVAAVAYHPLAMKLSFLVAEALLVGVLLRLLRARGVAPGRVAIYALNPLAVYAIALEGHNDSVHLALLLASVLFVSVKPKPTAAAIAWTCAVLTKAFAIVAAPAVIPATRPRHWIVPAGIVVAVAVIFRETGLAPLRTLGRFGGEMQTNDSIHALVAAALRVVGLSDPSFSRWATALLAGSAALFVIRATPDDPARRVALLVGTLLLALPTAHPWYFLMIVPFLCLFPWTGWLVFTGSCMLPYLAYAQIEATGEWVELDLVRWAAYAPLLAWLAFTAARRLRNPIDRGRPRGDAVRIATNPTLDSEHR